MGTRKEVASLANHTSSRFGLAEACQATNPLYDCSGQALLGKASYFAHMAFSAPPGVFSLTGHWKLPMFGRANRGTEPL